MKNEEDEPGDPTATLLLRDCSTNGTSVQAPGCAPRRPKAGCECELPHCSRFEFPIRSACPRDANWKARIVIDVEIEDCMFRPVLPRHLEVEGDKRRSRR